MKHILTALLLAFTVIGSAHAGTADDMLAKARASEARAHKRVEQAIACKADPKPCADVLRVRALAAEARAKRLSEQADGLVNVSADK